MNKLILGTVQFGLNYGINNITGKPNQAEIDAILYQAYKAGIRCLDTAEAYGNAHEAIGKFHIKYPNCIFDIITKLPHVIDEDLANKLEKYIEQLCVPKIKGMLFHSYNSYIENRGLIAKLNDYKKQDIIGLLGVSIYTNLQMDVVLADNNIDVIQLPFNLFDNLNLRGDIIKKAKDKGKVIHTRSAFLQGLFFAPLKDENKIAQALNKELMFIHKLSSENNISMSKIALNYCLQQNDIDNILIGVDNLSQLSENLADARHNLPDDIIQKINTISIKNTDLLNPSLWNQ